MMQKSKRETIGVQLGYAADPLGNGIVYARLRTTAGVRLVRAAFRVKRFLGTDGREVGYGALTAVATLLRERGVERVNIVLSDAPLVDDLTTHRAVPPPLVLPYVTLRCTLNRFAECSLKIACEDADLAQRALAEVTFHTAA